MIYINGRFLTRNVTGVERFSIEITKKLKEKLTDRIEVLCPKNIVNRELAEKLNAKVIGKTTGYLWEQVELPHYLKKKGSPLLLNLANLGPINYNNNFLVVHDVAFKKFSKSYSFLFRTYYNFAISVLIKRAKIIGTVSEFSRNELAKQYKIDKEKINVIYNAVSDNFYFTNEKKENYILAVSSIHYQKNFSLLLKAFTELALPDVKLYIIGSKNKTFSAYNDMFSDSIKHENIRFLGRVSDQELRMYLNKALLFVFPSLYEGFGLPPLEAQACGCPVLSSNSSSLPEVLGESAEYFNPYSLEDLKQKILFLLNNKKRREELIIKGFENIKRFSWDKSADKIISVVENYL